MIEIDCVKWRTRRWAAGNCAATGQGCCSQVLLSRPNSILTVSLLAVLIVNILILIDRKYLHKCANLSVPIHIAPITTWLPCQWKGALVEYYLPWPSWPLLTSPVTVTTSFAPSEPRCSPNRVFYYSLQFPRRRQKFPTGVPSLSSVSTAISTTS